MTPPTLPHKARAVQRESTTNTAWPVIECGSLTVFLELLAGHSATVLLMPIERRDALMARIDTRMAVQATAQIEDAPSRYPTVLAATFIAAVCTSLGGNGTLTFPCKEQAKDADILSRARALQGQLLCCLEHYIGRHPAVSCVRHPARYRIPEEWVWTSASLNGSGITSVSGCWIRSGLKAQDAHPCA